ncbi:LmbE family N-acetylglucosaminyl deacetylase [Lipingzhangella halophila]|uniref:LmbE family N-acetylglucosaminyl deacetylase n=1 Tax=Lipingzhangella halophila TaxID=1783352 RepID=A0A7W7RIT4_9ACTN|nr:PIG-L family deacetylase [Lipingzhangella halophila]MBB4932770.1 LmbE family N-acetylglucosaminyl deacetylase [Lipingzhangella halophila]
MSRASERTRRRPIGAEGTSESEWRTWPTLAELPTVELSGVRSVVVIAPHPDDEVLGFGGGLALLAGFGAQLRIVAVTEGEASHPNSTTLTRGEMARRREGERANALHHLGVDAEVVQLCLPDGAVATAEVEVATRLRALCVEFDLCVAPWRADLHPDHDAVGRAAHLACAAAATPLARYPVWMWHWARPGQPEVPWHEAHQIVLPEYVRRRKCAALGCFTSQIAPLSEYPEDAATLSPEMLAHFSRDTETVFW